MESNAEFDTIFEIIDRFCNNNILATTTTIDEKKRRKNNKNLFGLSISAVNSKHSHTHTYTRAHAQRRHKTQNLHNAKTPYQILRMEIDDGKMGVRGVCCQTLR